MKRAFVLLLPVALVPWHGAEAAPPPRPNIIFILADDLGMDGVGCYGSDLRKTPEIDKLATTGVRFETCYAAPLCGPSRSALMTGRFAFRTGGVANSSWEEGGSGPKAAEEHPIAALMKQAGYATGQSGKWRQIGETPKEWGFDEYMTAPAPGGWFWQDSFIKNGEVIKTQGAQYNPDLIQQFSLDFIRRHKDHPFFLYYAMHLVHKPCHYTPDSKDKTNGPERYDDDVAYMDKQVGQIVQELETLGLRQNTLIFFAGDNGTAAGHEATLHGRAIHGRKGDMHEGGSRVPMIASWPGVTPEGRVCSDIVCFVDVLSTCVDLAGGRLPAGFTFDGVSFAPQLRGEKGNPRSWAYVQLRNDWYLREPGWKLTKNGQLFDMGDAPYTEKLVEAVADTPASSAARARLSAALEELNPAAMRTRPAASKAKALTSQ